MGDFWKRIGCLGQLFIIWAVGFAGMILYARMGGFDEYAGTVPKPAFSRKECLNRQANERYGPNADDLTESQMGLIARACVVEQSEYEGW
ncbi:MAG: hypothetical protein V4618_09740 [Pseudomonadota bacterium]